MDKNNQQTFMDLFQEKSKEGGVFYDVLKRMRAYDSKIQEDASLAMMMGIIDPSSKLKLLKGVKRSGKTFVDIFKELIGKGKPEIGDIIKKGPEVTPYGQFELFSNLPNVLYKEGLGSSSNPMNRALRDILMKRKPKALSASEIAKQEIEKTREGIRTFGEALGRPTGRGYSEVNVEDLFKFFNKKN